MGEEKALRAGGKDVSGFGAWRRLGSLGATCGSREEGGRSTRTARPASRQPLQAQLRYLHKPRAGEEEPQAPSTVPRGPAQDAGKSAASSRRPAPSRPPHSRCSRPWWPLLPPGSSPGLPPPASPKASQLRPRPQPRPRPPAAAATAAPASPPGSASRRRPVLRSTHSAGRTHRRNKVPAPPTAARMRKWSRAHLGPAHTPASGPGLLCPATDPGFRRSLQKRLVSERSSNTKPQEEKASRCHPKTSR